MQRVGAACGRRRGTWLALFRADASQWRGVATEEKAPRRPAGYWADAGHRRAFLDQVAAKYGVEKAEDWQRVTADAVLQEGGRGLLGRFGNSLAAALLDSYPHMAEVECRPRHRHGHWADAEKCRRFMDGLKEDFGVRQAADWRKVSTKDVAKKGGGGLLTRHGGSVFRVLQAVYPEEALVEHECRPMLPKGYWQQREKRKAFVERLREAHGISQAEEWQRVTVQDVREAGGTGFLLQYRSLQEALVDLCDDVNEEDQVRPRRAIDFWDNSENLRSFLEGVKADLRISEQADWLRVSAVQLIELGAAPLLRRMTLLEALRRAYPKDRWEEGMLAPSMKKSSQRVLRLSLHDIFHGRQQQPWVSMSTEPQADAM